MKVWYGTVRYGNHTTAVKGTKTLQPTATTTTNSNDNDNNNTHITYEKYKLHDVLQAG
jgi:hypothetical protein